MSNLPNVKYCVIFSVDTSNVDTYVIQNASNFWLLNIKKHLKDPRNSNLRNLTKHNKITKKCILCTI